MLKSHGNKHVARLTMTRQDLVSEERSEPAVESRLGGRFRGSASLTVASKFV